MSLKWDRDFDLLIDMEDVPTLAQKKIEERRAALLAERDSLRRELADLDSRLEAVSGTYSNQALLEEMLKLKVSDAESVRKVLKDREAGVRNRINELEKILKTLPATGVD